MARQLKVLSIEVKDRSSILHLINNMPNLQTLLVRCEDGIDIESSAGDQLDKWLEEQLPSTCMIVRNEISHRSIKLLIR